MLALEYTGVRSERIRVPTAHGALNIERTGHWGRDDHAVLLVHGFGLNASLWRGVSARLAHGGCLVLAPDLLGHGASARPLQTSFNLVAHADSLAAALAALGISRATVVGEEVGGLLGLLLAARHPEVVSQLAIINPPDHRALPPGPVRAMHRAAERFTGGLMDNRLGATALMAALLRDATSDPAQLPSATVARYLAPWLAHGGAAQLCRMAQELARETITEDTLSAVVADTLIIRSESDRGVSGAVAQALAEKLPNAVLQAFPHHGRLLGEEAPHALSRMLLDWNRAPVDWAATEGAVQA